MPRAYIDRLVDPLLDDLLAELPAILLSGPRASGKTTTAARRSGTMLRLDDPAVARAVSANVDAAVDDETGLVCIDEWQEVPEILGAVKRAVDRLPAQAGRFLLTGSVGAELGPDGWPATGRVVFVPVLGLVERELAGRNRHRSPVDVLFGGEAAMLRGADPCLDGRDYVSKALRGGFPELVRIERPDVRRRWLDAYVDQATHRDAAVLGGQRDPRRMRRYLSAIARCTAGVVAQKTLLDAAEVTRPTGLAYDSLLESIHLTDQVPAFASNRLAQLVRTPKRFLVEPAFLGPLAGVDDRACRRDGDLLGRVIETFVAAQLRPELAVAHVRATMQHLREAHGRQEVDLLLVATDGRVVGIEVKAAAAPRPDAARHLYWLRDRLGDDFVAGVVLHTGPRTFPMGDRVVAAPISSLWSTP